MWHQTGSGNGIKWFAPASIFLLAWSGIAFLGCYSFTIPSAFLHHLSTLPSDENERCSVFFKPCYSLGSPNLCLNPAHNIHSPRPRKILACPTSIIIIPQKCAANKRRLIYQDLNSSKLHILLLVLFISN